MKDLLQIAPFAGVNTEPLRISSNDAAARWCTLHANPLVLTRHITAAALMIIVAAAGCGPQTSLSERRAANASLDMEFHRTHAPPIDHPLTLEDALEYADRYNIRVWIAAQESRLQHELTTESTLRMLPSLMTGAEYNERSRYDASSSQSIETGKESLEPSFSSEKRARTFDISATWNLLDFGISFLRTRQQSNRALIAQENERRVRQNLALEVTRAYWEAVTARDSAAEAERISAQVSAALEGIRKEIDEKALSQIDGLRQETSLLQRFEELRSYRRDRLNAEMELAAMIGLPPGTSFTLAEIDCDLPVEPLSLDAVELEWEALRHRPELFQKDLEEVMLHDEALVAIAEMLPSPAMFWRFDYDSNRFLVYNTWNNVGLRASWDLLTIPAQMKQHATTKLQAELIARERTAIAVAMLTQLHLSMIEYRESAEQREFSRALSQKCDSLLEAVRSEEEQGKSHGGETLDQELKCLRARARYLADHAKLMISVARIINTVGRDLPGQPDDDADAAAPDEPEGMERIPADTQRAD